MDVKKVALLVGALVIATGSAPAVPPITGLADTPFWTNHDAIEAKELPASIVVLGGGAIGAELAQVYARFGVDTTIVEAAPRLLPLEEPEAGTVLAAPRTLALTGVIAWEAQVAARGHRDAANGALRDYAQLEGEALVLGAQDRLEIWAPKRWDGYDDQLRDPDAFAAARLTQALIRARTK